MMNKEVFDQTFREEIYHINSKPLIVIQTPWEKLGQNEKELLSKIIGALKLSIDSVQIISRPDLQISTLERMSKSIIYFGNQSSGYSNHTPYTVNGVSFICSESLNQLLTNDEARKQLWQAMKKLFLGH